MVVDDRKELLDRAEIMNRVYNRDVVQLDADISRLERLLAKEELGRNSSAFLSLDNVFINFQRFWISIFKTIFLFLNDIPKFSLQYSIVRRSRPK